MRIESESVLMPNLAGLRRLSTMQPKHTRLLSQLQLAKLWAGRLYVDFEYDITKFVAELTGRRVRENQRLKVFDSLKASAQE